MAGGLEAGATFAGVQVDRLIAAGGMGEVYLAHDPTLDRRVALKVVAPALAADPRYRERFLREARLAASLEHPAIVPVYAAGESDGELFLAMRFVEGGTLADRLAARGPLPPAEAVRLLAPVADALDAAHAAGLVHRDVKPGNVLLQGDMGLLADFGLARSMSGADDLSRPEGSVTGTVGYVAPEQIEGDTVAGPADQYALACVLFECLTGQAPFDRPTDLAVVYAHLSDPPPSAAALRPALPRQLDRVFARGLAKEPAARFATCRDLVNAIATACGLAATAPSHRHRTSIAVGAGLAVLAAVAVVAALASRGGGGQTSAPPPAGDGVAILDPVSLTVRRRVPIADTPSSIALGAGSAWVLNPDSLTITRIDATTGTSKTFGVGQRPFDLAFGAGALWVTTGNASTTPFAGGTATAVTRIDPATNTPTGAPINLPENQTAPLGPSGRGQIAFGLGSVWVVDPDGSVSRIAPGADQPTVIRDVGAFAIAVGDDQVWTLTDRGLRRIDPETDIADAPIPLQAAGPTSLAVGGGAVWVADPDRGLVIRVDPGPPAQTQTVATALGAATVSFSDGRVWVADGLGGTAMAIDPATSQPVSSIPIGGAPQAVAAGAGGVWVPTVGTATPVRAVAAPPRPDDVPGCGPVYQAATGRPEYLITSTLPLRGGFAAAGLSMTSAIRFVVQEHRFRAGRFTIGYQSCDDVGSDESSTKAEAACAGTGRASAATARVIGVIGSWQSSCTEIALPYLNQAAGGPIAMINASSTDPSLTTDRQYFPSGTRSFARVIATEDGQGTAGAILAQRLGVRRPFVLTEDLGGFWYASTVADAFRREAARRGLLVAGEAMWEGFGPTSPYRAVAAAVARSGADAIYLVGFPDPGFDPLMAALRRRLGRGMRIISPDGVLPLDTPDAIGMYVTATARTNDELSVTGRRWAQRFAATQPRGAVTEWSPMAAEATEVLLAAIARSDGTRASVTNAMLHSSFTDSILGPFRFTPTGDIDSAPISVLRYVGGKQPAPNFAPDFQGTVLEPAITVSR
jgi:ABC-type branched-subunit amino acid transport system substrate-binding protein